MYLFLWEVMYARDSNAKIFAVGRQLQKEKQQDRKYHLNREVV